MNKKSYWLDLFTGTTWGEFLKDGGKISGFRKSRWKTAQKIQPGDYFLCYLISVSRLIGNRPTFSKLSPPLSENCRFISFSGLKDQIRQVSSIIRFLKPNFLEELSESCGLEEA